MMASVNVYSFLILLCVLRMDVLNAKHVMIMPFLATSHCLEMRSIGDELVARGHKVTAFLPDYYNHELCLSGSKINHLPYPVDSVTAKTITSMIEEQLAGVLTEEYSPFRFFSTVSTIQKLVCNASLTATYQMRDILHQQEFDLAIIDAIVFLKCFFAVPHFLSIPYVAQGSFISQYSGNLPLQSNSYPNILHPFLTYSRTFTFSQRLRSFIFEVVFSLASQYLIPEVDCGAILHKNYANVSFGDLYKKSVLFIENSDHVADSPKATFPNFIQTGPLTATKPKPLTPDLEKFVSGSKEGIVYISFGSMFQNLPEHIAAKLTSAFEQLKLRVVLKGKENSERGNVKTVKWLNQNDILGHNKTLLFVSHCGKNSFFESLYHGVPIVCTPLNNDAYMIANKVDFYQIGGQLDIRTATEKDILTTIIKILKDTTIRGNMKRASNMIRDRPFTPAAKATNAIEHYFKYGTEYMTSPLQELSFFAYSGGDVWLVFFMFTFGLCWLVTKIFLKLVLRR